MEVAKIPGQKRTVSGAKANHRLRQSGWLPAVIYGHGEAPETVALSKHELVLALDRNAHLIEVQVDGKAEQYLLKEVQYDHLQIDPIHADLMRVDLDERVEVQVAINTKGHAAGVKAGGELTQYMADITLECRVTAIPEEIEIDISGLEIDDQIAVGDLKLPEGVTTDVEPHELVVAVRPKREADEEEEAGAEGEAQAEPELIGRQAPEEGEES